MWRPCGAPVSPLEAPALSAGARRGGGRKDRLPGCSHDEQRWQPYERPVIRPQSAAMAACVAHGSQPQRCSFDAGVEAVLLTGCDVGSTTFAAPVTMWKHTRKTLKLWRPTASHCRNTLQLE